MKCITVIPNHSKPKLTFRVHVVNSFLACLGLLVSFGQSVQLFGSETTVIVMVQETVIRNRAPNKKIKIMK